MIIMIFNKKLFLSILMYISNFAKRASLTFCHVFDTYFVLNGVNSQSMFVGGIEVTQECFNGCYLSSFSNVSIKRGDKNKHKT